MSPTPAEIRELKRKIDDLSKEVQDLRDFKRKIELGSYWLRCAFYITGACVAFFITTYEFFLKHFSVK